MFCPAPVASFNYRTVHSWLKRNCWIDQQPAGECVTTSFFVQFIFGWPVRIGEYHAWNQNPNGLILDLTVAQYGQRHSTKLVWPATIFDNKGDRTYASMDLSIEDWRIKKHINSVPLFRWLERLERHLPVSFGLPQHELLIRVNEAIKNLAWPVNRNQMKIAR